MRLLEQLLPAPRPRIPRVRACRVLLRMAERSGACTPGRGKRVAAGLLGREIGMSSARQAMLADTTACSARCRPPTSPRHPPNSATRYARSTSTSTTT